MLIDTNITDVINIQYKNLMNVVFFVIVIVKALKIDRSTTADDNKLFKVTAADENKNFKLCGNDKRDLRNLFTIVFFSPSN